VRIKAIGVVGLVILPTIRLASFWAACKEMSEIIHISL